MLCVIGIGSPHGDDQLGWRLAEELARSGRSGVLARAVSTPIDLLDHLDGCDALIVIDACDAGLAPGAVVVHEWPVAIEACGRASSHGLGVDSVLRLAGSLGNLPARVVLIGVQKTRCEPAGALSAEVTQAWPAIVTEVAAILDAITGRA